MVSIQHYTIDENYNFPICSFYVVDQLPCGYIINTILIKPCITLHITPLDHPSP
jgi:hypothetical protein